MRGGEQADFNIFVYSYGERQVAPPRSPANVEHTWRVVIARLLDWRRRSYVTVLIVRAIQIGGATAWRWRSARGLFTWVSGSRENTCDGDEGADGCVDSRVIAPLIRWVNENGMFYMWLSVY